MWQLKIKYMNKLYHILQFFHYRLFLLYNLQFPIQFIAFRYNEYFFFQAMGTINLYFTHLKSLIYYSTPSIQHLQLDHKLTSQEEVYMHFTSFILLLLLLILLLLHPISFKIIFKSFHLKHKDFSHIFIFKHRKFEFK